MSAAEATPAAEVEGDQAASEALLCICGDPGCDNSLDLTQLEELPVSTAHHRSKMHKALKSEDCGTVCQLLHSGLKFCTSGKDNCYVRIVKYCKASFLDEALKRNPEGVNVHGSNGRTLLMLCDNIEKMQVLVKYGPDLDAVNDAGDTVLLHFMKHNLIHFVNRIVDFMIDLDGGFDTDDDEEVNLNRPVVQNWVDECKAMLQYIVASGVNINAVDACGNTSLKFMLNLFKSGYAFYENVVEEENQDSFHSKKICFYENEIAAQALSTLLQAGAIIPGPDGNGTTALMLACLSPWNFDNIQLLVQRGVDVNEKDNEGRNAIHYLLQSFADHCNCDMVCREFNWQQSGTVDKILCFLLDSGCELQGKEILLFDPVGCSKVKDCLVFNYLMSLKDSCLNKRDFAEKQSLKNSQETVGFLQLFLQRHMCYDRGDFHMVLDLNDVDLLSKEIEAGLDVRQRMAEPWEGNYQYEKMWSDKLCVPDALRRMVLMKVLVCDHPDGSEDDHPEYFKALDGVLLLLLRFWPHPPLALLIFAFRTFTWFRPNDEDSFTSLLQFLYNVGGPLTVGSEVYHATRGVLLSQVKKCPKLQPVLETFDELHAEIPTLEQICRNKVRGCLKEVDNTGLDLSHPELRSLPAPVLKLLSFGKSAPKPAVSAEEPQASSESSQSSSESTQASGESTQASDEFSQA